MCLIFCPFFPQPRSRFFFTKKVSGESGQRFQAGDAAQAPCSAACAQRRAVPCSTSVEAERLYPESSKCSRGFFRYRPAGLSAFLGTWSPRLVRRMPRPMHFSLLRRCVSTRNLVMWWYGGFCPILRCSVFARGSKGARWSRAAASSFHFCDQVMCSLCESCPQDRPANMTVMRDVRDKGASKSAEGCAARG